MNDEMDLLASLAGKKGKKKTRSLGRARFEASIIATYNAYLPFYEDVVLRRVPTKNIIQPIITAQHAYIC